MTNQERTQCQVPAALTEPDVGGFADLIVTRFFAPDGTIKSRYLNHVKSLCFPAQKADQLGAVEIAHASS